MTKILVWPDATYLDASEYSEAGFSYKGDDYTVIDLQQIADGRMTVWDTAGIEYMRKHHMPACRQSEFLQAEHQLKALTTMFRNYRNTMREHLSRLHAEQSSAMAKLSAEQAAILANKEQEIKTILTARDQWVKELQAKLREATRMLHESEEVNAELENRIAVLSAQPPSPAFQGDLAEENRRLKSQLAGATARIRKQIDGYGTDWRAKAEAAEAELAKLKNTSAISSDIEDNLRKERDRLGVLLAKHGVCTDCGDMYEHHEDEPLASCSCQTAEWGNGVSTPYMALQRALREARDAEHYQAEKVEELEITVDELKGEIIEMKRNISCAIGLLQEVE